MHDRPLAGRRSMVGAASGASPGGLGFGRAEASRGTCLQEGEEITRAFRIGRVFGIDIEIDYTWFLIFFLLVYMLASASGPFGRSILALPTWLRSGISAVAALLFFASVLLHELSHSVVALRNGLSITGITLFIFGGVSKMKGEPPNPGVEFRMAIAGPVASFVLAGVFLALSRVGHTSLAGGVFATVFLWLAAINGLLGVFNLLPGFPLDGGRVLRAALWYRLHNLVEATRIASASGRGVGALMIAGGVFLFLSGEPLNGIWLALIGWFLANAAHASYEQLVLRQALAGVPVSSVMTRDVESVPAGSTLDEVVHEHVLVHQHIAYPVFDDSRLLGMLTLSAIRDVPREQRERVTAREAARPLPESQTISPEADVWEALTKIATSGHSPLFVTSGGALVGIVSRSDIMRLMRTRMALDAR
jgi:Zn-dependent protease/CBS domain-containing protein